MQTTIRRWGNSQGLRIPRDLLRQLGWELQDDVELIVSGDKIIIRKNKPQHTREAAANRIREMRKTVTNLDAKAEMQAYLEERYETK